MTRTGNQPPLQPTPQTIGRRSCCTNSRGAFRVALSEICSNSSHSMSFVALCEIRILICLPLRKVSQLAFEKKGLLPAVRQLTSGYLIFAACVRMDAARWQEAKVIRAIALTGRLVSAHISSGRIYARQRRRKHDSTEGLYCISIDSRSGSLDYYRRVWRSTFSECASWTWNASPIRDRDCQA